MNAMSEVKMSGIKSLDFAPLNPLSTSATHPAGKTTTSAILAFLLRELGCNPTAIIGGSGPNFEDSSGGMFVSPRGPLGRTSSLESGSGAAVPPFNWFVLEADEYDGAFQYLSPLFTV